MEIIIKIYGTWNYDTKDFSKIIKPTCTRKVNKKTGVNFIT